MPLRSQEAQACWNPGSRGCVLCGQVCESEPTSPFVTAEVCLTELLTEYEIAECRCKLGAGQS